MPQQTLAVIIPVFNGAETLLRTLDSVVTQTRQPDEIVVVDDASTNPEMRELLENLAASATYCEIPIKVLVNPVNAGVGAARNRGILAAQADMLAFLDADDWWAPTHLQRSVEDLVRSGATFVASNFYAIGPDKKPVLQNCATIASRRECWNGGHHLWGPRTHYFYRGFIGILTVLVWREALIRAGGFDSQHRYALDWECWHAILASTSRGFFYISPVPTAYYRLSSTGLTSRTMARLAERESFLPRYVKDVAHMGGVWWPVLLFRGWLTVQYETLMPLWHKRAWAQVARVVARAPAAWAWVWWQTLVMEPFGTGERPNFLAMVKSTPALGVRAHEEVAPARLIA